MLIMYNACVGSSRQAVLHVLPGVSHAKLKCQSFPWNQSFCCLLVQMQLDRLRTSVVSPNVPNSSHYKPNRSFELFQWNLDDIKNSCSATNFCGLDPLWPIQYGGIIKVSIWAYQILPNMWACTGCCYKRSQASLTETTRNVKLCVSYTFSFEACQLLIRKKI
jgi:hypothetical protein